MTLGLLGFAEKEINEVIAADDNTVSPTEALQKLEGISRDFVDTSDEMTDKGIILKVATEVHNVISSYNKEGVYLKTASAEALVPAINALTRMNGIPKKMPGIEQFGKMSPASVGNALALESLGEIAASAWDAIISAIKRVIQWVSDSITGIKNFFLKLKKERQLKNLEREADSLRKEIKDLESSAKKASVEEISLSQSESEIVAGYLAITGQPALLIQSDLPYVPELLVTCYPQPRSTSDMTLMFRDVMNTVKGVDRYGALKEDKLSGLGDLQDIFKEIRVCVEKGNLDGMTDQSIYNMVSAITHSEDKDNKKYAAVAGHAVYFPESENQSVRVEPDPSTAKNRDDIKANKLCMPILSLSAVDRFIGTKRADQIEKQIIELYDIVKKSLDEAVSDMKDIAKYNMGENSARVAQANQALAAYSKITSFISIMTTYELREAAAIERYVETSVRGIRGLVEYFKNSGGGGGITADEELIESLL